MSSASRSTGEPAATDGTHDGAGGPGRRGLGAATIRELAARHGIRPSKALGQHFLIDPNLARALAADADVGGGDRVVEVGAGFGSLTLALAATGAEVLAIEFDRGLVGALGEVVGASPRVRVLHDDAMRLDWRAVLGDAGSWTLAANLPYNVATPLLLDLLAGSPSIERFVVMVQREVGERLAASPGDDGYGAVSLKVAYRATATILRKVPPEVFWPRPTVASVVVRLERRASPPVEVDEPRLWRLVDAGFAERRKTMRNALRRLGLSVGDAERALAAAGIAPNARAEELDLEAFARLAEAAP